MSAPPEVGTAKRLGLFLWRHRTVVAGLAALWNLANFFLQPLLAPPPLPQWLPHVVPLVGACVFAILCLVSFIYDRRSRRN